MRSSATSMTPHLSVRGIAKSFGPTVALDDISLELAHGEFVTLLGDSGCGKTTMLRILAGFVTPDSGRIERAGHDITHLAPGARRMGVVFQSYALFPTKTVEQNIGFPLLMSRRPQQASAARVRELARLVEIEKLLDRYPHELSGGQQQRVALARALASEPEVLLLDEPLSALDARIRAKLRSELRSLVDALRVTTLYVTHDQEEALALSDRIAVMRAGRIEQIGAPADIYHRPRSRFVASFIGASNLVEGRARDEGIEIDGETWPARLPEGVAAGMPVTAVVRPEHVELDSGSGSGGVPARVEAVTFLGSTLRLSLELASGRRLICDRNSADGIAVTHGMPVRIRARPDRLVVISDTAR